VAGRGARGQGGGGRGEPPHAVEHLAVGLRGGEGRARVDRARLGIGRARRSREHRVHVEARARRAVQWLQAQDEHGTRGHAQSARERATQAVWAQGVERRAGVEVAACPISTG